MQKDSRPERQDRILGARLPLDLSAADDDAGGKVHDDVVSESTGITRDAAVRAAEWQRLARDIHDSLIPTLYGIALGAERLTELAQDDTTREVARYVHDLAGGALGEIRALIFDLRPERLQGAGLGTALRELASMIEARQQVRVEVRVPREPDCSPQVREALYRIVQEALSNVVRHAHATSVTVAVKAQRSKVTVVIAEDGVGLDAGSDQPGHLGQQSMRERATVLGCSLVVSRRLSGGTTVTAVIPSEGRAPLTSAS